MNNKISHYIPNSLTYLSLACGLSSIILSNQAYMLQAGLLILVSFIFDSLDGFSARKLNAVSKLGLQLDSLTDMVSFGVAPLLLIFNHLNSRGFSSFWIFPLLILAAWAGAFRLARFNLQPLKISSHDDSLGLPITQAGITLSMAVLSDLSYTNYSLPNGVYVVLLLVLSYLMASRICFPSMLWLFTSRLHIAVLLLLGFLTLLFVSPFTSLLIFCLSSLAVSICRSLYIRNSPGSAAL
ncbi:MAG: CDP-diacylglycerol--serine O-phosphatidyltransferase [Anaerolineales bacterium]|nr:CDP-diacylglycerol--serine O-phosphatidyltransferase [Anaerolineales bacterium]